MTEEQVFLNALELADPAERTAYLEKASGGDAEFRCQVEELLAAHFKSGEFLDEAIWRQMGAGPATPINDNTVSLHGNLGGDVTAKERKHDGESDDLQFLQPSTRPESLGRIGHYDALQVLGRGGFGIVFRVFDEVLQRVVALKVLMPALAATSPARKRFLREARASAQVRHEHVVQVYAVEEQPLPYLVMEFIPGESLQQRLDRTGPLEVPEIVRLGRQIAEGLAAAHATGLIHRDIKPSNVLLEVGPQERAKITDFGLARAADDASLTHSGALAGTPMYMAPEQARGESFDNRADLFSLGSVLYVMATGRPPFRASTNFAVLKRVVEDNPRPIREVIPEIPQWLSNLIDRLHAKKPEDRIQTAQEVADILTDCEAQLKASGGVKSISVTIPPRKSAAGQFGRWIWVAAAALLLPILALAMTEFAGVTHLFQTRQSTADRLKNGDARDGQRERTEGKRLSTDFTNTLGMTFKLIPAGKFTMGSSQEEIDFCLKSTDGDDSWLKWAKQHVPAEGPEHEVMITQPFYMGTTDVTVGQFQQFVEEDDYPVGDAQWKDPGFDNHPVVWVSWHNAVDFCKWLSKKEGKEYRLPTEAEWEYCCRAGKPGTRYCFGDENAQLENYAWYVQNSGNSRHRVGKKKANDWGLYDMHGSAWEWCQDWYDPNYYKNSPAKDPPGGVGSERVVRGGAYDSLALVCRSAIRSHNDPNQRYGEIGFRVLLDSPPSAVTTESRAED